MRSTDKLHISGMDMVRDEIETITFSQFIHETLDVPFDMIYKDFMVKEEKKNGKKSNLARFAQCDLQRIEEDL